jgi:hypothetical protein
MHLLYHAVNITFSTGVSAANVSMLAFGPVRRISKGQLSCLTCQTGGTETNSRTVITHQPLIDLDVQFICITEYTVTFTPSILVVSFSTSTKQPWSQIPRYWAPHSSSERTPRSR